jgi:hypothetical protein
MLGNNCPEKHPPTKWEAFKGMTPQQRLAKVLERELYKLCFRHLRAKECWAQGKVPNCNINGCHAPHRPLLHRALVVGQAMIVQEVGDGQGQVHLCQEDVREKAAGKTSCPHAPYNWGAMDTLITHAAARETGLLPLQHSTMTVWFGRQVHEHQLLLHGAGRQRR